MCLNITGNAVNRDDVRKFRDLERFRRFRGGSEIQRRFLVSEEIHEFGVESEMSQRIFKGDSEQI